MIKFNTIHKIPQKDMDQNIYCGGKFDNLLTFCLFSKYFSCS